MKVHGVVLSPFVRKVLAVCSLKGLEYELDPVMPGSTSPEYLQISPLGKVPAFEDGGYEFDPSVYPKTAVYLDRVRNHSVMVPLLAAEQGMLAKMFG